MAIKQEVAYGVIEAITDLRKDEELEDFTVIVDGIPVRCHRFILGACSLFFRGLFRSGMKEDEENCAPLKTVSHPTFKLILSALYTGCDILTEENVIDVWRATHMLDIGFLVKECEKFIQQNISIDNFEKIYETAKLLDSRVILRTEYNFMTQNFDLIRTSQTFLNLSFSEVSALVETDELVTSSEDKVVESILQWVSYSPPETSEQGTDIKGLAVQSEDKDQEHQLNADELSKEEPVNIRNDNKDRKTNEEVDENDDLQNTSDEGTSRKENLTQDTGNQNRVQDNMTFPNEAATQASASKHKQTRTSMLPERRQHLLSLISNSRSCLLSPQYLEKLLSKPIIFDNASLRSIILKAVYYQLQPGHRHGQWPMAAIHRSNSSVKNLVISTAVNNDYSRWNERAEVIHARAFLDKEITFRLTTEALSGRLTAFDNELYELRYDGLYILRNNSWTEIIGCDFSNNTFVIPLGNSVYFLGKHRTMYAAQAVPMPVRPMVELMSVDPKASTPALKKHSRFPGESSIDGAAKYDDRILVFSSHVSGENQIETAVHTFDPSNESWDRLENLKGPAKDIISFKDDNNTFVLQTNGNLWRVSGDTDGSVKIVFCKRAWDFDWQLYGAAICRKKLIIFGGKLPDDKKLVSFTFPGSFDSILYYTFGTRVCVIPIMLPSSYLVTEK